MTLSHVFCQTLTDEDFTVTHNFPMIALGRQFKGKMNRRAACSQMDTFDFRACSKLKIRSCEKISFQSSRIYFEQIKRMARFQAKTNISTNCYECTTTNWWTHWIWRHTSSGRVYYLLSQNLKFLWNKYSILKAYCWNKLTKAQSSSELKSMAANKSLCPKMFEQWTIDRNTVGVKDSF